MTKPSAFRATFSDLKNIKTRQVVQLIFEIPLADFDAAYDVLGGMPNPACERWFAIAALKDQQSSPSAVAKPDPVSTAPAGSGKRDWRDMPAGQQTGLRRNEATFQAFLREQRASDWAETSTDGSMDIRAVECIRLICGVDSCSNLNTNHKARVIWHQLDSQYQAWLAKERVGA